MTAAIDDIQRLGAYPLMGPELQERLRREILPSIEQLELQLRRKLDGTAAGQVRNPSAEKIPPGYGDKVAEYRRRLSQGK